MSSTRTRLMQTALGTMHTLKLHDLLRPLSEGLGMILTLHRVRPLSEMERDLGAFAVFNPNGLLEVTPDFLDATLDALTAQGMALVSLDEALEALNNPLHRKGRFATLTFDDGYTDNRDHALPVLEAHEAPAMVYVPSDFPQGKGELWWVVLEQIIRDADTLTRPDAPDLDPVDVRTAEDKQRFFETVYWSLRAMSQDRQRATMRAFAQAYGVDVTAACRRLILPTEDVKNFAAHPLIEIGAHTVAHRAIAGLDRSEAMREMRSGTDWLETTLGRRPAHFSFPYGDKGSAAQRDFDLAREAGFRSAVTTRKGMLYREHRDHFFSLPRVSLNGDFQQAHFVELFASGAPFLLANRLRKVA
ncbi:MAG: polysaccharide deacetylase family protein [Pseudomonadota bacterium]